MSVIHPINKVYSYKINNINVKAGDLICTVNGDSSSIVGQFWWSLGKLIYGDVDHEAYLHWP